MNNCIVPVVADTHSNTRTGLYNPATLVGGVSPREASSFQKAMWKDWCRFWEEVAEVKRKEKLPAYGVFAGDMIDASGKGSGGYICWKESEAVALTVFALEPALETLDMVFFVKGTEYHGGRQAVFEELLADVVTISEPDVNTGEPAWWHLQADFGGVLFDVAHHPETTGTRSYTWDAAMARNSFIIRQRCMDNGEPVPDVAIRAHAHHKGSIKPDKPPAMFFCHPWQFTTAYGYRRGNTHMEPPGGFIFVCRDGEYKVYPKTFVQERRQIWKKKQSTAPLQKLMRSLRSRKQ